MPELPRQGSGAGMTVIERWECPTHGATRIAFGDGPEVQPRVRVCICGREAVWVKYVPAEQLRGAVQENERLRQSIESMARAFDRKGQRIIAQGMRAILADATTDHRAIQAGIEDA